MTRFKQIKSQTADAKFLLFQVSFDFFNSSHFNMTNLGMFLFHFSWNVYVCFFRVTLKER